MNKKYDVAILGVGIGLNYGSVLTYFGLYRVLKRFYQNVALVPKITNNVNDIELKNSHALRFAKEHFELTSVYNLDTVHELNELCDTFVIGSDQVFNYGVSKNFGKAFYMDFTADDKKRVAYASSFGHGIDFAPPEERIIIAELFKRFDAISVREQDGVRLLREIYGVEGTRVCDPVILAGIDEYLPLINNARQDVKQKGSFVLAYILDPTDEKRDLILHACEKLKAKHVIVLDGFNNLFDKNKQLMNLDGILSDVQTEDLLYLYQNCEYVVTDSFHGTVIASMFNKPFATFSNKRRGISRMIQLFTTIGHKERFITDHTKAIELFDNFEAIDFAVINNALEKERAFSYNWLQSALEAPHKKNALSSVNAFTKRTIISTLDMKNCTGCAACTNICPHDALSLTPNEHGFYKSSLQEEKCTECGMCTKVCPALTLPLKKNFTVPKCYALIAANKELLYSSSSGGLFPLLAKQTLQKGGVVCGVAWKDDFSVEHIIIDKDEDLPKLQKSKYMQSHPGDVYKKIKSKLGKGIPVLFSGCPCQVAGLTAYLGKARGQKKLLTLDLLCGNAPSPLFFKKYVDEAFNPPGLKEYEFRHKVKGWNSDCLTLTLTDGTTQVRRGASQDAYQSVYHNHTMCPYHCQHCKYQQLPRFGDLTIGDFWGLSKRDSTINTSEGVSVALVNSEKGKAALASIPTEEIALLKETPLEWIGGNGYALPGKRNYASASRDKFFGAIKHMPFSKAVDYALALATPVSKALDIKGFAPLQFSSQQSRFRFDPADFEEHFIHGFTTLMVKDERSIRGVRAWIPLSRKLLKSEKYKFNIRFKVKTTSPDINFHIYNEETKKLQVIKAVKLPGHEDFQEYSVEFTPNSDSYNSFMIGAFHIRGKGNWFAVDYLSILRSV